MPGCASRRAPPPWHSWHSCTGTIRKQASIKDLWSGSTVPNPHASLALLPPWHCGVQPLRYPARGLLEPGHGWGRHQTDRRGRRPLVMWYRIDSMAIQPERGRLDELGPGLVQVLIALLRTTGLGLEDRLACQVSVLPARFGQEHLGGGELVRPSSHFLESATAAPARPGSSIPSRAGSGPAAGPGARPAGYRGVRRPGRSSGSDGGPGARGSRYRRGRRPGAVSRPPPPPGIVPILVDLDQQLVGGQMRGGQPEAPFEAIDDVLLGGDDFRIVRRLALYPGGGRLRNGDMGGPSSSASRKPTSSTCSRATWPQTIAWARARSEGLNDATVSRSWIYATQCSTAPSSSPSGSSQMSPEAVPSRVDRHRLGDPGELRDQAPGLRPVHVLDGLDHRPDQHGGEPLGQLGVDLAQAVAQRADQPEDLGQSWAAAKVRNCRSRSRIGSPKTSFSMGSRLAESRSRTAPPSGQAAWRSHGPSASGRGGPSWPGSPPCHRDRGGQAAHEELPLAQGRAPRQARASSPSRRPHRRPGASPALRTSPAWRTISAEAAAFRLNHDPVRGQRAIRSFSSCEPNRSWI